MPPIGHVFPTLTQLSSLPSSPFPNPFLLRRLCHLYLSFYHLPRHILHTSLSLLRLRPVTHLARPHGRQQLPHHPALRPLHPLFEPVPSQTLVIPIDLPAVRLAVLLRVPLGGLDGGAGVDEEERRHGEGGERGGDGLFGGE